MNLKELRIKNNFTLEEIANILGVSKQVVSAWENKYKPIPNDRLRKLEDIFEAPEIYRTYNVKLTYWQLQDILKLYPNIKTSIN